MSDRDSMSEVGVLGEMGLAYFEYYICLMVLCVTPGQVCVSNLYRAGYVGVLLSSFYSVCLWNVIFLAHHCLTIDKTGVPLTPQLS